MSDIGFIGLGKMGACMARRLMSAGLSVAVVAHRNRSSIDTLVAQGAVEHRSTVEMVEHCPTIVTCVSDASAVETIAAEIIPHLGSHHMWIDATTSDPEVSREIWHQLEAKGATFADAPITGGPLQAERGELASLVGCRREKFNRVKAVVTHYSTIVQRFGEPGTGHTAKLLNNFVTQSTGTLLAEAYARARRAGVDWRALYDVMWTGAARSGTLEKVVGPALDGLPAQNQFSLMHARKDIAYYRRLCERMDGQPSELAEAAYAMLDRAIDQGLGEENVSALLEADLLSRRAS
ncbi:MAG: NAD(P)-dependent oxidoreductase [Pseudomonadota bacterium]